MRITSLKELHDRVKSAWKAHGSSGQELAVSTKALDEGIKRSMMNELTTSKYQIEEIGRYLTTAAYQTTVQGSFITLHCIHQRDHVGTEVPLVLLQHVVKRAECVLSICENKTHLTLWLIPCMILKTFPKNYRDIVSTVHVNSAYTYATGNEIFIYRKEEFPKVALHETIHHVCSIDTHGAWSQDVLLKLFKGFKISPKTKLRPNEAVVETWAELFHMMFVSVQYNIPFKVLYAAETQWAVTQTKRILQKQHRMKTSWKEETHAFSYYVIRAMFMLDITNFMRHSMDKNMDALADLALATLASKKFASRLKNTQLPTHDSFRMTITGDL